MSTLEPSFIKKWRSSVFIAGVYLHGLKNKERNTKRKKRRERNRGWFVKPDSDVCHGKIGIPEVCSGNNPKIIEKMG